MTNQQPSPKTPLGFDDFIGILVAFSTIGAILFWSFSRKDEGFKVINFLTPSPSPSVQPTLLPQTTESPPASISPLPTRTPEALLPVQSDTSQGVPGVVPVPITKTPGQPIKYADVPEDFWARPFIDALSARGIVFGKDDNYFRPNEPVTRAEFAGLLQQSFEQTPGQRAIGFKDIPANFWAIPKIDSATKTGFLKGYPGKVFQPQQQIPRVQVLVALASGLNLKSPSSPTQVLQLYEDTAQIPNYATDKIAAATNAGLVANYPEPKRLNPNQPTTHAEVAVMLYQALVQAGKAKPIQSQYLVQPRSGGNRE